MTDVFQRFEEACAILADGLASRPLSTWSPNELAQMWADACFDAAINRHLATVLLHRLDANPIPFEAQLLVRSSVTDHAELIEPLPNFEKFFPPNLPQ
jgi:hypothetical protein